MRPDPLPAGSRHGKIQEKMNRTKQISKPFYFILGILVLLLLKLAGFDQALFPSANPGPVKREERYARVERARRDSDARLRQIFENLHLDYPPKRIYIRAFKQERLIELWAQAGDSTYQRISTYPFCSFSGMLGPKRRQGDCQIPEGFYFIDRFNPFSRFFLSLGLNYPNRSDRIRGDRINPGGDIFIHGSCVTIGCIPITNEKIKELYWVAEQARRLGQNRIPVHIFPGKLNKNKLNNLRKLAAQPFFWGRFKFLIGNNHPHSTGELIQFWENLKTVVDHFEKDHRLPEIQINDRGEYFIRDNPPTR
jgi:murein L,D-transpeptidase YafK